MKSILIGWMVCVLLMVPCRLFAAEVSDYDRIINYLEEVQQARRDLGYGILQMKAGLSDNYDQLNSEHRHFQLLVSQAEEVFSVFSPRYDQVLNSIKLKSTRLNNSFEKFKENHALVVNGENYIPRLSKEIKRIISNMDLSICSTNFNDRLLMMLEQTINSDLLALSKLMTPEISVKEFSCAEKFIVLNNLLSDIHHHLNVYHQSKASLGAQISLILQWERQEYIGQLLKELLAERANENEVQQTKINRLIAGVIIIVSVFFLGIVLFLRYYISTRHHKKQSQTDALTGVGNRYYLNKYLEIKLKRVKRNGLAVFFIDLDGFKAVNDKLSHAAGDDVLIEIASNIEKTTRREDKLFRIGGDEFILVSTSISNQGGLKRIADSLLASCHCRLGEEENQQEVTSSIGIAYIERSGLTAESVISMADAAMYQAKQAGKNRYVFA